MSLFDRFRRKPPDTEAVTVESMPQLLRELSNERYRQSSRSQRIMGGYPLTHNGTWVAA